METGGAIGYHPHSQVHSRTTECISRLGLERGTSSPSGVDTNRPCVGVAASEHSFAPASLISCPAPTVPIQPPNIYNAVWLRTQGLSDRVIQRVMSSRAVSTRQHYSPQWDIFVAWCVSNKLDPFNTSVSLLTRFMEHLFHDRQVQVRTIIIGRPLPSIGGLR